MNSHADHLNVSLNKLSFSWIGLVAFIDYRVSLHHKPVSTPVAQQTNIKLNSSLKQAICIFFNAPSNCFPRQLRCCVWLHLKEGGISTPLAPQKVWQSKLLLLKPGLWTQSAACLSLWYQTYYGSFCLPQCAVGAVLWLVKQADTVTAVIMAGENS